MDVARPLTEDEQRRLDEVVLDNSDYLNRASEAFENGLIAQRLWNAARQPLDIDKDALRDGIGELGSIARQVGRKVLQVTVAGIVVLRSRRRVSNIPDSD